MAKVQCAVIQPTDGVEFGMPYIIKVVDLETEREKANEATGGNWGINIITHFECEVTE
jgi:hypothetical protein